MDWFMGKGRRKDKDCPTPPTIDEKQYMEVECLKQRVIDADFFKLVPLPSSLDCNEWLATHTISFFNHVNLMYGVVSEYCTSESCSSMVGPDNVQYYWLDEKGKKVKQSAPQYIDHMMSFVQKTVTDESHFPTKFGHEFPAGFPDTVRKIHRYLLHVLAHVYHSHYALMVTVGLHGHLNTLFSHFMVFSIHFQLLQEKEAEVLMDLHNGLLKAMQDPCPSATQSGKEDSPVLDGGDTVMGTASSPSPPQTVSVSESDNTGNGSQKTGLASEKVRSGSRSSSENGASVTGIGVDSGKSGNVDIQYI